MSMQWLISTQTAATPIAPRALLRRGRPDELRVASGCLHRERTRRSQGSPPRVVPGHAATKVVETRGRGNAILGGVAIFHHPGATAQRLNQRRAVREPGGGHQAAGSRRSRPQGRCGAAEEEATDTHGACRRAGQCWLPLIDQWCRRHGPLGCHCHAWAINFGIRSLNLWRRYGS